MKGCNKKTYTYYKGFHNQELVGFEVGFTLKNKE